MDAIARLRAIGIHGKLISHDLPTIQLGSQARPDPMAITLFSLEDNLQPVSGWKTVLVDKESSSPTLTYDQFLAAISIQVSSDTGPRVPIAVCRGEVADL